VAGRAALILGGEPVPLCSLAAVLGLEAPPPPEPLPVVVVGQGARRVAVAVDNLLGEREALLKDLDAFAASPDRWAGAILLEDGAVCLVLNPSLEWGVGGGWAPDRAAAPAPAAPARPSRGKGTILVVDDSLTTRTLEKSILEAHGFCVQLALDGMEALARLREAPPDLVITDVQMPRLDGFGLVEQMKQDPRLSRIPVIIVSSLEKREDQERGLSLGADAYVVKRKFDHEELLEIVRQIL
jgi:two-component system chemotaxis sensor kinase CheA